MAVYTSLSSGSASSPDQDSSIAYLCYCLLIVILQIFAVIQIINIPVNMIKLFYKILYE